MASRGFRAATLLLTGCIATILFLHLLLPGTLAAVFPYSPENESEFTDVLGPEGTTALYPEPLNDDERLEALIAKTGVPLLDLAAGEIYSAHTRDDTALRSQATRICSLAGDARRDALALDVSPEFAPAHADFITALDEFIAVGTLLGGNTPINQSMVDGAMDRLTLGAEHLSGAMRGCRPPETRPTPTEHAVEPAPAFPNALQIGERFCYDDGNRANMGSLIVVRTRTFSSFYTTGIHPQTYAAKPGESFLLIAVKVTHLGHKGDGTNTRLQAPRESAFTLHHAGATYRPMAPPGPTNQGESYSGRSLERHDSMDGYLFFEVPENFDPALAYLEVSIGSSRPVWHLGEGAAAR
ncbi:MAG: hypothetical protein WBK56_09935 [Methanoculleus sp.]